MFQLKSSLEVAFKHEMAGEATIADRILSEKNLRESKDRGREIATKILDTIEQNGLPGAHI